MRSITVLLVSTALIVTMAACQEPIEKEGSPGNNGATTDEAVLVLTNDTDQPIYVDPPCDSSWFRIGLDGQEFAIPGVGCPVCECDADGCATCGACMVTPPEEVAPGESLEFAWDGTFFARPDAQFDCFERREATGETLDVRFCYGSTASETEVTDLTCEEESFVFGSTDRVEHLASSAMSAPEPSPECDAADSNGFFPDCSVCGDDCDTIDAPGASGNACGCGGGCPCGLRCGSYEIAPNVVVDNICVR